jgi:hypothetical protein
LVYDVVEKHELAARTDPENCQDHDQQDGTTEGTEGKQHAVANDVLPQLTGASLVEIIDVEPAAVSERRVRARASSGTELGEKGREPQDEPRLEIERPKEAVRRSRPGA